jgi:hypothetical protein
MALTEQEEFELLELERQRALATAAPAPKPSLKDIGIQKIGAMVPKSPKDLLPPLPTKMGDVPGAQMLSKGPKIVAENPEGAAKALPAILGTGASVLAAPAALPPLVAAGGVGLATAGGAYLRDKYMDKEPGEIAKNATIEGMLGMGSELLPGAIAGAKPFAKEFGLGAIDTLAQLPQGTASTAYANTKILAKGLGEKYLPQIKTAAQGLSQLVKESMERVKGEYGAAVEKVSKAKGGRPSISAPILKDSLDNLASGVGLNKTGVQPGTDAVRTEVKKLLDEFANDVSRPVKKTVVEKGPLGENITKIVDEMEIRGNIPLNKALDLRRKLGEMADWAEAAPGQGQQAASIRKTYDQVTEFIHKQHPEIAKVDADYKKLIDASGYLRRKLGIRPGEEASQVSIEKMEEFIRTINNPAKKEAMQDAVDTMSKELGRKRSVVKKAAEINASRELAPMFSRRKSINVLGKLGKLVDVAAMPFTGPRAMATVIKATKKASTALGKVPGKKQIATGAGLGAGYAAKK